MTIIKRFNQILILSILIFSLYVSSPVISNDSGIELNTADDPDYPGIFKLLNYNIQGGEVGDDWTGVLDVENADVVALVESGRWVPGETFNTAVDEINARFPDEIPYEGYTFNADSLTDGQAILSRYPIVDANAYPAVILDDGSQHNLNHELLEVVIEVNGLNIYIYTVHLTCCAGGFSARMKEMEGMINHFDSLGDVPIIFTGDFNSESPEDEAFLDENSDLGNEPVDMLLNSSHEMGSTQHEFLDMYRYLNPYSPGYTYIDSLYISRLDNIFINEPLYNSLVSSTSLDFYEPAISGSDHFPMTGVFNLHYDEIDITPPLPVGHVQVDVQTEYATISWDANQDADFYKYSVYRNDCLIIDLENGTTSFVDDYEYGSNVIYIYDVSATDLLEHESVLSNQVYINTSYGVLSKPSAPVLTSTKLESGDYLLEWNVDDEGGYPIEYYRIYRSYSEGGSEWHHYSTKTSLNITVSTTKIPLYYRVRAYNYLGAGEMSNIVNDSTSSTLNTEASTSTIDKPIFNINIRDQPVNCPEPLVILKSPLELTTSSSTTSSSTTSSSTTPSSTPTETTAFPIAGIFGFLTLMAILPLKRRDN